jgi:hypothetical protein
MKRPPTLMVVKCRNSNNESSKQVSLWVPLFIIGPLILLILLVLLLLVLPFLFLYVLFTWDTRWWKYLRHGIPVFFEMMHALLGLKVDVENQQQKIYVDVQ